MCCIRCGPTWLKEQKNRGRQLFGGKFQHSVAITTNMICEKCDWFVYLTISAFAYWGTNVASVGFRRVFWKIKVLPICVTTWTCWKEYIVRNENDNENDNYSKNANGHGPMTINKTPNTPGLWCQGSFTFLGCFFLSLKETFLLFCNRVCLLTAGDCLPPVLSALTGQVENIERQDGREN